MKIAMISFRLPVAGEKRGGCERVAHDLAHGLARRGHQVTVWTSDPKPPGAAYAVSRCPGTRLLRHWLGFRLVSGYLGNFLVLLPHYRDADVIIAHGDSLLLPARALPVLRIMHGSALDEARTATSLPRKILQFGVYLQELLTVRTQTAIAISRATQLRYPSIRHVIPNGVDTARFFPSSTKSADPTILFVGTLGGRKRGLLLLQWFVEIIRPALPNARLWMVTEQAGPRAEAVRYLTGVPEAALADLYRSAWVFASPSLYEGFGLPYLEAMASGTAVLATANPGSREVSANGRYAWLAARDSDFAPALLILLNDPAARRAWAARGLERSRELSMDRTLDRYEALLKALASAQVAQPVPA